jgi:hypothetical protein
MFRTDTRKLVLAIGLGAALLILCIAAHLIIDAHFSSDPRSDMDAEMLWFFLVGSVFFPGALRRYRAGRQAEQKIPWYRRLDLILCLGALVSGLVFALSVVQKWFEFVLIQGIGSTSSPVFSEGRLEALTIALLASYGCWIALLLLFIYQALKQRKKTLPEQPE